MADRRWGNVWLAVNQEILDEFRRRRQIEAAGGEYTYPVDGPMDDRSYEIFLNAKGDNAVVERLFKPVNNQGEILKLFSYNTPNRDFRDDIDYLEDTWGLDIRAVGAWWFDNGLQGGMRPAADPADPPEGTPIWPIPNNLYLFMPDYVEYDQDGNEISRTPATSNDDLRDINLLYGQTPRDFTQYGQPRN